MNAGQLRLFGVLMGALAGGLAAIWFWPGATEPTPFDHGAVSALSITRELTEREPTVSLLKTDGIWRVTEPFQADADPDMVFQLIEVARMAGLGEPMELSGDLADFGLNPPQATLTVTSGDSASTVRIGRKAPVGFHTYAEVDTVLHLVPGDLLEAVGKRAGEYRDHRIFRFDPKAVRRVAIHSPQGVLQATSTPAGWFIDGFSRVDLDALDDLLIDLQRLQVELFLDLDHETIDDPAFVVELETEGGLERLFVGKDTPYGTLVLYQDGLDGVVPTEVLKMLTRGPTDLGVHQAFPFDAKKTTRIELSGATTEDRSRPEAGWGEDSLAKLLAHAQFVYRMDPPELGEVQLTVRLTDDVRTHTIEIGAAQDGFRAVRDTGGGAPVRVPAEELAGLFP